MLFSCSGPPIGGEQYCTYLPPSAVLYSYEYSSGEGRYSRLDHSVQSSAQPCHYQLDDVDLHGHSTTHAPAQVSATRAAVAFPRRPKYWVPVLTLAAAVAETAIPAARFTVNRYLSAATRGTNSGSVPILPLLSSASSPPPHASQIGSQILSRKGHLLDYKKVVLSRPDPDNRFSFLCVIHSFIHHSHHLAFPILPLIPLFVALLSQSIC